MQIKIFNNLVYCKIRRKSISFSHRKRYFIPVLTSMIICYLIRYFTSARKGILFRKSKSYTSKKFAIFPKNAFNILCEFKFSNANIKRKELAT